MGKKKVGINRIMTPIVALLFFLLLHMFLNYGSFAYCMNRGSYEEVTAVVDKPTTDKFLLLIPMVTIQYSYEGQAFTEDEYFVTQKFFFLSDNPGTELTIYVNKEAPNHTIFKTHFLGNPLNWLLLLLEGICIFRLVKRIRKAGLGKQYNRKKKMEVA